MKGKLKTEKVNMINIQWEMMKWDVSILGYPFLFIALFELSMSFFPI